MENLAPRQDNSGNKFKAFFSKIKASKIIKWFLIVFVVLFVVLLFLPNFIPTDTYRSRIETLVAEKTSGELKIKGDLRFSIVPYLGAKAEQIEFTLEDKEVKLDYARVKVKLLPLLSKIVKLDEFSVKDLYFKMDDLPMEQIHVSSMTADVNMSSFSRPVYLSLNAVINKKKFKNELMIDNPDGFLKNKETMLEFDLTSSLMDIFYNGNIMQTTEGELFANGNLDFNANDISNIMWFVNYKPALSPVKSIKMNGDLSFTPKVIELKNSKINFDGVAAKIDFYSRYAQEKPYIKADFNLVDDLDLNKFINGCPIPDLTQCTADCGGRANICTIDYDKRMDAIEAKGEKDPTKMVLLLGQGEIDAQAQPFTWDKTPIDFSFMDMVNADVAIKTNKITYQNIHIDSYEGYITLKDKVLRAVTNEMRAYDGLMTADEGVDATNAVPTMYSKFTAKGLNIDRLVEDFVVQSNHRFGGVVNSSGSLTMQGKSIYDFVSTLNGNMKFSLDDVVYRGADLEELFSDWPENPADWRGFADRANKVDMSKQTKISDLSGTATITNGVAYNSDLKGIAPFMGISGKGSVNLPKYTVDYRVLLAPKEDFAGDSEELFKGFKIPVKIKGRIDNPKISVDGSELVKQATKALTDELERKAKEELRRAEERAKEELRRAEEKIKEQTKEKIDTEINKATDKIKDEIQDLFKF